MSCPDCFRGSANIHSGTPTGQDTTIHNLKCYIATPPNPSPSTSTILFLPDAFGYEFINNRILADAYAAQTGFRVLIPDVIPGGACSTSVMLDMDHLDDPVKWWDVPRQLARAWAVVKLIFNFAPFLIRASPYKTYPAMLEFARKLKAESKAGGGKLGVCGFCWGGLPSTLLCKEPAVEGGSERLVDAHFTAHPSRVDAPGMIVEAVQKFKVPYSLAIGDNDFVMAKGEVEKTEAKLRQVVGKGDGENGFHYEVVTYPGCGHGFSVRAKLGDEVAAKGAEKALEQAVAWFKRWL
ncbi:alpha/beta-hydrolase [Aaosphaeria arxii CBS 175.79]|uniref:Alpha/beta-hydrolase n=1 Tax=Aaosphaeria arxii CBS 175.79 TaxID=1450172 RepID=A0A6A5X7P8_9PLEO|nr:alpha/beta-hydrolase [Aaosphaeria arxii CBS 175.79]KAF2009055.1 alpha/beta-hydrolase [Aaosphaeria arxii CBS 175.79]